MPYPPQALYATQTLRLAPTTPPETHQASHDAATLALRTAQVELYCDHEAAAMTALHAARRELLGEAAEEAGLLASVEEAVWHVRRHDTERAQATIAFVRDALR